MSIYLARILTGGCLLTPNNYLYEPDNPSYIEHKQQKRWIWFTYAEWIPVLLFPILKHHNITGSLRAGLHLDSFGSRYSRSRQKLGVSLGLTRIQSGCLSKIGHRILIKPKKNPRKKYWWEAGHLFWIQILNGVEIRIKDSVHVLQVGRDLSWSIN